MNTSATPVLYGVAVADDGNDEWPAAGHAILDELKARGRMALIAAAPADADALVERLRTDLGVGVLRLGRALADTPQPPSVSDVESWCGDATVIADLDVLLWPEMNMTPLHLLATRARRRATIGVWPGDVSGGRARYGTPGRPDHHDIPLRDTVILRPRPTRFPDEVPLTIERIL